MKEDYSKYLSTLTNQELIEITLDPDIYEIESVKKAHEIIIERNISKEEINYATLHYNKAQDKQIDSPNYISSFQQKAIDFFKPIFSNGEDITPEKWVNSFLFLVGIQVVWILIEIITALNSYLDFVTLIYYGLGLTYLSVIVFLLYKKKKWGWILLFSNHLISGVASVISILLFITFYEYADQSDMGEFLIGLIINVVFITFLIKREIYSYFSITTEEMKKYIKQISIFTVSLAMIVTAIFYFDSI
ncbi:hypothetical protein JBL43_02390 [Aureibaculum sp. A20]|uniref:DUF1129 family protein n=1 Tax=Aureibaculum flavum TaxID=2795986 RepID=A0ABS0WM94_9FLAO|nr:hypothetical protein [Aureibaculum flavum]MBJ2173069.1 hypothetical protein [Aureibaculum flavum]